MPLGSTAWGPVAIVANILSTPFTLTIDPAAVSVAVTMDNSLLIAGISRSITAQYSGPSTNNQFVDYGGATSSTLGAADKDRHNNTVEWGVISGPLPDVGSSGRQIRVACLLGAAVAALSGHVVTS